MNNIRNFCIIAHIDHGKSTLADRLLQITGTIPERKMREQVLDSMDLERERGITIKMQPVRMDYTFDATDYILNLIDTPGHIDFAYEVSRALKAVEGAILLVDATQGVQAQTLSTLAKAQEAGLVIIPAINKIDAPLARVPEVKVEVAKLLSISESAILLVSARTGDGVENLLQEVIRRVPPPKSNSGSEARALVFDFSYSNHTGITAYVRVFDGVLSARDKFTLCASKQIFTPISVGTFQPDETPSDALSAGEIGYIVTGIKEPGVAAVGDTVARANTPIEPLPGYDRPRPVVWASIYPESQDSVNELRAALLRYQLSDSAFTFEEESSGVLGRGFRCGFLGMLHLEIVIERLHREFNLALIVTTPSITYEVVDRRGKRIVVHSPSRFPDDGDVSEVYEPWVEAKIITPSEYMERVMPLLYDHEATVLATDNFGEARNELVVRMPLRELMRGFFDSVKSLSSGFASLSYTLHPLEKADVVRMDILVAEEPVPAFARIVPRRRIQSEAESAVEKLWKLLPKQLFVTKIQARAGGRIIASRSLSPMRKDVTGYLYGGDRTRKMKLWQAQKEGKKRLKEEGKGKVRIPQDVFIKMVRGDAE